MEILEPLFEVIGEAIFEVASSIGVELMSGMGAERRGERTPLSIIEKPYSNQIGNGQSVLLDKLKTAVRRQV